MNVRVATVRVISAIVEDGRSLSDCLPIESQRFSDPRDRALLQAMCFGVCRWFFRLDAIYKKLVQKPLKPKDSDVYFLILVGLYQLIDMRVPPYAAVSETVDATDKSWAKGLINAVLRQYLRRTEELSKLNTLSHPDWFIQKIKKEYRKEWRDILQANNQHPPFSLRVNQRRNSREKYLKILAAEKIHAHIIPETENGIVLKDALDVQHLPGFATGEVSVQDGAAQLAAELLSLTPGLRVLDACAAPGGKTAHILEIQPNTECIAIDRDATRLKRVQENLTRLKLKATCIAKDAAILPSWWDEKPFDRILLDAPCSASGVIRRHPDIKLLRRATDISEFAKQQLRLLNALWPVLKSGGKLVYATCSIFPEENVQVMKEFLTQQSNAREEKITAEWGVPCDIGRQILPGMHNMDGFYYACLTKS